MTAEDEADLRRRWAEIRRRQGLPSDISDPRVVNRVAGILLRGDRRPERDRTPATEPGSCSTSLISPTTTPDPHPASPTGGACASE